MFKMNDILFTGIRIRVGAGSVLSYAECAC